MLGILGVILNMIPGVSSMVTALTTTYFNSKVKLTSARLGADTAVATAVVSAAAKAQAIEVDRLKVLAGSKVLMFLTLGFALPWMIYEWKVVFWDNVWMLGASSTPGIKGEVAGWATTIISCLFGSSTVLTAGHMFFNRNKAGE